MKGKGRIEVAAYGSADAEHLVEKELGRICEGARVEITGLARVGEERRIAEEFAVDYRVQWIVALDAGTAEEARKGALRRARDRVVGTRFHRLEWERVRLEIRG